MNNNDKSTLARRLYDEVARLRGFRENINVLLMLFESVARIDVDLLGATFVAEHWIKSVVTSDYVIYRRADEEDDLTELVLPCVKDESYAARILVACARYAEFNHTTIAEALERWIEEARSKTRCDVSTPNLSGFLKESDYFGSPYDAAKEASNATVATFG